MFSFLCHGRVGVFGLGTLSTIKLVFGFVGVIEGKNAALLWVEVFQQQPRRCCGRCECSVSSAIRERLKPASTEGVTVEAPEVQYVVDVIVIEF